MKPYLLFLLLFLSAQAGIAQPPRLKFDHFGEKEGLADPQIKFIQQDSLGYLWMGTQLGLARYDGYKIKVYRVGQKNAVLSMISDAGNNLWFSTHAAGLQKYNQSTDSFTAYPYPPLLDGNYVTLLQFADAKGALWGYSYNNSTHQHHVFRFDPANNHIQYFGNGQKGAEFFDVTGALIKSKAAGGTIWMGAKDGLYKYDDKAAIFRPYLVTRDTASQKSVYKINEAPSEPGVLWLNVFDHRSKKYLIERLDTRDKSFATYSHSDSPGLSAGNDTINDVYQDARHRLWFATQNGLMLFKKQTRSFSVYTPVDTVKEGDKNRIMHIVEAKNGILWLNSGKGLLYFDPETGIFRRYTASRDQTDALSWNVLNSLFFDKWGTLWAGNGQYGIDKLNVLTSAFQTFPLMVRDGSAYRSGMTNNIVHWGDKYCLFSNNRGLYQWQPGSNDPIEVYKIRKEDKGIDAILITNDGKICFGNGNGLQIYNPVDHQLQSYANKPDDSTSISSNKINYMLQDNNGLIWVGTEDKGICTFDPLTHRFKRYPYYTRKFGKAAGQLDAAGINAIYQDRQHTIWVGTNTGGINRFDQKTGKFTAYNADARFHVSSISHIFEDSEGRFWVGTYPDGLFEFDRKARHYTRHLNEDNGLLFNSVTAITEDKRGFLWVNSVRGLNRVNKADLTVKTFPVKTIIPGKSILDDYNLIEVNGLTLMVLTDGIATFNLRDLDGNPYPPAVHIQKVSYSNPASKADTTAYRFTYGLKQIELPWNQNKLTFTYVALHYATPLQNKYAYKLDGYESEWVQAGTQRSAVYTNLSPGTYTFRVKAANSDGVWNNTADTFIITINPPWWQRWWAWLIYIVLAASAVYAFVLHRSRKLIDDNRVLEQKVQVRTEEVLQQKEEIEAQRDNLEQAYSDLKSTQNQLIQSEKMASLGELTAGIAHEIENPLNFVNNFSEVNQEMIVELEDELKAGNVDEALAIAADIKQNEEKISHHGKRADAIVKGMLQHSRTSTGERLPTNINTLAEEFLKLSYNAIRSKNKSFNADIVTNLAPEMPQIKVVQQDIGRVLLNLFNNAFYAINDKQKKAGADYQPGIVVSTTSGNGHITLAVKDNGNGIPDAIKDKIMQPFFTTKPTGEGTGLGLSLSYDIIVKGHGGKIDINTKEAEFTEFIVTLPGGLNK